MHHGREFLSLGMWDSEKAQHLRETCARVRFSFLLTLFSPLLTRFPTPPQTLGSWGMGSV